MKLPIESPPRTPAVPSCSQVIPQAVPETGIIRSVPVKAFGVGGTVLKFKGVNEGPTSML